MKKYILFFIVAFALHTQIFAATGEYAYLTVTRADGSEKSYELKNLKITFSASDMQFNENGSVSSVALSALSGGKMRFTELPTVIKAAKFENAVVSEGDNLKISVEKAALLLLYSTNGELLLSQKLPAGTSAVNISHLQAGIYVAKIGNKAIKLEKR